MAYLECENLKLDYPDFSLKLSFSMEKGELVCLIGPSGSGKSTLLSLLCGTDEPDSGKIFLDGKDITDEDIRKRGIGMVFQDFSLFHSMDVEANIMYGMKAMTEEEKKSRARELLKMVELPGYGKRKTYRLSGGEAQRVALARAVAAKPRILLLDEPLSALDAPLRRHLRTVIRTIHDSTGITMLYVTHDREEAFAIADRIMIMRSGRITAQGKPEELYREPNSLFTAMFTGEGSVIPASIFNSNDEGNVLFFRPEDIIFNNADDKDNYYILNNAEIQSVEYNGSNYIVYLLFKGNAITAVTKHKPTEKTVNAAVSKNAVKIFKSDSLNSLS
ncbi:MAG: ABC transporter ATP-binding protein [Spirochaetales bacterium]